MKNFIATLSFIKNSPSLMHKYLIPDIKPATNFFKLFHKCIFFFDYYKRRKSAKLYFDKQKNLFLDQNGYLIMKNSELEVSVIQALRQIKSISQNINWEIEINQSKKNFLVQYPIDLTKKENFFLFNILLNKKIFKNLVNYFREIPVLLSASLWYSPNKTFEKNRSQEFHQDSDDTKQIKLLFPLEIISENDGPLTIIDSKKSKKIFTKLKSKNFRKKFGFLVQNQKFSDEIIDSFNPEKIKMTGNLGDCFFADTSNCYHFGSRPSVGSNPRLMLAFHIVSGQSRKLPLWNKKIYRINNFSIEKIFKNYSVKKEELKLFLTYYLSNIKYKFYKVGINKIL
jgi:hypothetical protein